MDSELFTLLRKFQLRLNHLSDHLEEDRELVTQNIYDRNRTILKQVRERVLYFFSLLLSRPATNPCYEYCVGECNWCQQMYSMRQELYDALAFWSVMSPGEETTATQTVLPELLNA